MTARLLRCVSGVVAIDDDEAIAKLGPVDAIADTVGGEVAAKLIAKVKQGGSFGCASVLPEGTSALNPTVKITRVFAQPDPSKVREFADDVREATLFCRSAAGLLCAMRPMHRCWRKSAVLGRSSYWRLIGKAKFLQTAEAWRTQQGRNFSPG